MANAKDFNAQLGSVAAKLGGLGAAVQLDATMMAYESIASRTAVRTGFLRTSLTATEGNEAPPGVGKPNPDKTYTADDSRAAAALHAAAAKHGPVTIGFQAEYAPYEEDRKHMVSAVLTQWPAIVDEAVKNAGGHK